MASILCASRPDAFKMAIFAGGFPPTDPEAMALFAGKIPLGIPSLHIVGSKDPLVSRERSEAMAALFSSARMLEHGGGHVVPVRDVDGSEVVS